jgi:site-specific DNA-methyltransferase (adenine-specific)
MIEQFENKIINADCLDILKQLPDKSVDCILTDPPYFGIVKNDWDNQWKDIFDFQRWVGELGKEFLRVLKDNGSFYWFGDDKTIAYCQVELDKYFRLLNSIVWRKSGAYYGKLGAENVFRSYGTITERCLFYDKGEDKTGLEMVKEVMPNPVADYLKSELLRKFETIANIRKFVVHELKMDSAMVNRWFDGDSIITKEKWDTIKEKLGGDYLSKEYEELRKEYEELRRVWNNDRKAFDVLDFPVCTDDGRFHPTQKPLSLIMYLMERSTRQGDVVLDCFGGSCTTAIACHNLKRKFICIEKDFDYWKASCKRLEDHQRQGVLF